MGSVRHAVLDVHECDHFYIGEVTVDEGTQTGPASSCVEGTRTLASDTARPPGDGGAGHFPEDTPEAVTCIPGGGHHYEYDPTDVLQLHHADALYVGASSDTAPLVQTMRGMSADGTDIAEQKETKTEVDR